MSKKQNIVFKITRKYNYLDAIDDVNLLGWRTPFKIVKGGETIVTYANFSLTYADINGFIRNKKIEDGRHLICCLIDILNSLFKEEEV